jgi:hypothetical protein
MFLAGDGFRGRLTGTRENELATDFVASRFARLGLKSVVEDGSHFFRYHLLLAERVEPGSLEVQGVNVSFTQRFESGSDWYPLRASASGRAGGGFTFAGFGIVAPKFGRDDYRDLNVSGRIVVVLDHEPGERDPASPFDGLVLSEHADLARKARLAQERGAVALLVAPDVHNHPGPVNFPADAAAYWPSQPPRDERYMTPSKIEPIMIPVAQISRSTAEALWRGTGIMSLQELARGAESSSGRGGSMSVPDMQSVSLTTQVRRRLLPDRSVIGAIEGSDPKLKNEWVVVSCHHDHDGADGAMVLNGADDNGSGTVGLIAIAEAYAMAARQGHRPKRSVLFASFNSEERGLLGSWAFVENPPAGVPLKDVVAVLNMDMIGRDEEVPESAGPKFRGLAPQSADSNRDTFTLLGSSRSHDLTAMIQKSNATGGYGLKIKTGMDNNISNLLRRSDHWPFLQKGIPAVWFHTGLHPDYHTAGDRPEKIRYDKMERIVRLVHQASWDLANAVSRPSLSRPNGPTPAAERTTTGR